jgi:hypothetical protein
VFAAATRLPQDCAPAARLPHTEGHPPADRPGAPDRTSTPPPPTHSRTEKIRLKGAVFESCAAAAAAA